MNKDNIKQTPTKNTLTIAGSHSNSRLQQSRFQTSNSTTSLAFPTGFPSPKEPLKIKVGRFEPLADSEPIADDLAKLLSPSREIINLQKMFQNKDHYKMSGSISPTTKGTTSRAINSGLFTTRETQSEKQSQGQDTNVFHTYNRDKYALPNELKTMDLVMEKFKKLASEQQIKPDSSSYQRLAVERAILSNEKKGRNEITTFLKQPVKEQIAIAQRTEPLNNVIHKKLGLDPITKQRRENCFASIIDQDFQHRGGLRKDTFTSPKDDPSKYQKILPPDILESREKISSLGSIPKTLTHLKNDLAGQAQANAKFFKAPEVNFNQHLKQNEQEERGNYTTDPDNFSAIDLNTEIFQDEINTSAKTLSLFEFDIKEEAMPKQVNPIGKNDEMNQDQKLTKNPPKSENKLNQDYHRVPAEVEKLEWSQSTIIDATPRVKEELTNKVSLVDENKRLNEEIEKLRAKLKLYEETRSKP